MNPRANHGSRSATFYWAAFNPFRFSTKYNEMTGTYAGKDVGLYYYGERWGRKKGHVLQLNLDRGEGFRKSWSMPRKLRVEYPGACYHVINRGNYRADIFATAGARAAFMRCLGEACKKSGWRLHAYVLMRNHYHLALETPAGNLVAGMQWLQATFANRFNNLRRERGHLFQGRYKALLVEPGEALGHVCHYIHLNPVRAGVVSVSGLKEFRDSSYWRCGTRRAARPTST